MSVKTQSRRVSLFTLPQGLSAILSPLLVILVYSLIPVGTQRTCFSYAADRVTEHFVVQRRALCIAVIIDCLDCTDAEALCLSHGVDVGPKKQKLPIVFLFLPPDHEKQCGQFMH